MYIFITKTSYMNVILRGFMWVWICLLTYTKIDVFCLPLSTNASSPLNLTFVIPISSTWFLFVNFQLFFCLTLLFCYDGNNIFSWFQNNNTILLVTLPYYEESWIIIEIGSLSIARSCWNIFGRFEEGTPAGF